MSDYDPFALARASEFSDDQINSLWVELGRNVIDAVIEPSSGWSKFILGGKGSGKTHLLRYHSYPVRRLRNSKMSGVDIVLNAGYLAVFIRAATLDAMKFEGIFDTERKMQNAFGVYLELKLVESLVHALIDIKQSSPETEFNENVFLNRTKELITNTGLSTCQSLEDLHGWIFNNIKEIDSAIRLAAYTGDFSKVLPFAVGDFCVPIWRHGATLTNQFLNIKLIYMIDEIEVLTAAQQKIINTLIRYSGESVSFRATGRLYGVKTQETISGEENRRGAEFKITNLDEILMKYKNYPTFARKFIIKRLEPLSNGVKLGERELIERFEGFSSIDLFEKELKRKGVVELGSILALFENALAATKTFDEYEIKSIIEGLTNGLPLLLQRLNIILFCKKIGKDINHEDLTSMVRDASLLFVKSQGDAPSWYRNAYSHWSYDLFSQLCRTSKKALKVPYAGLSTFIKISSGNPRNLLVLLGEINDILIYKGGKFLSSEKISIDTQTEAAQMAASFIMSSDSNYGYDSDLAKEAIERLAQLLQTARFSLNIPEVSPLAVTFDEAGLSVHAKEVLKSALNYSLIFDRKARPDRNNPYSTRRKIQLNPMLSANFGLGIGLRGDISLNEAMANAIFDPEQKESFNTIIKAAERKWNSLFSVGNSYVEFRQGELF